MGHEPHSRRPRNDYGKFIAVILTLCLLAVTGYALQHTISCFLLSWVIAYLLDPLLLRAEQNGIKRIYALGLLYVILGILTVFFLTFIVPAITINWNAFIRDLPLYIQKLKQLAMEWKERLPDRYGSAEINWLIEKTTGKIDTVAENTGTWVYGFGTSIFFNLFNIVLSPILVFFMLYYKQTVKETISSWIPS
ncbi:MAG: AI-2E family transporter, partial [Steroidobacteraceae bacterium]|nr:AI-2E family transporter [Deltaproteobacteria bacterium]